MELKTPRLLLREVRLADSAAIHAYRADDRYWKYYEHGNWNDVRDDREVRYYIEEARARPRRNYWFSIVLLESGGMVGLCGLRTRRLVDFGRPDAGHEADIGYELDPVYWGRGLATEATQALVDFGFESLGLHRVWAYCLAENEASWRVMTKLGMSREAHLRENEYMQGRWWDTYIYAILADEWRTRRPD